VILFYREGWLVGNAGLGGAILVILLANAITLCTSLSMSAIVTNIRIKGCGAYYLVSRSLGPEIGGAIGVSLFFAQAFSIAFYIIGFTKALALFEPFSAIDPVALNMATLAILTVLSIFSANIAIRAQYLIFLLLFAAIGAFVLGNTAFDTSPQWFGDFTQGDFWQSFAIFFPAATGIFAGLSLSGDLKEPHRNLPRGTIASVIVTGVVYLVLAAIFSTNHAPAVMLANESLMQTSAAIPELVIAGVFAATISSAIGMLLAAPRTLQALALDGMAPGVFARGRGPANEPRLAMLVSVLLAATLLGAGSIDFVSQILTMFFLTSYGSVNLVAALEALVGNPAYRPKFHIHWIVSFLGAIGCFLVMFMIDALATTVALLVILLLYGWYARRNLQTNWGDIRKGFWASVIETGMVNYHKYDLHPRNFRPHIAILEGQRRGRKILVDTADLLVGKHGIISDYVFLTEKNQQTPEAAADEFGRMRQFLDENRTPYIFPEIIRSRNMEQAQLLVLQADGVGTFKANTILADIYCDDDSIEEQLRLVPDYLGLGKNVLLVKAAANEQVAQSRIDIWLSGFTSNLSIMLLIPYLVTRNPDWTGTRICLRMIVHTEDERQRAQKNFQAILAHARIPAEAEILALHDGHGLGQGSVREGVPTGKGKKNVFSRIMDFIRDFAVESYTDDEHARINGIIAERSADASMVVLGMRIPEKGKEKRYAREIKTLIEKLPMTILVKGQDMVNLFK